MPSANFSLFLCTLFPVFASSLSLYSYVSSRSSLVLCLPSSIDERSIQYQVLGLLCAHKIMISLSHFLFLSFSPRKLITSLTKHVSLLPLPLLAVPLLISCHCCCCCCCLRVAHELQCACTARARDASLFIHEDSELCCESMRA